MLALMVVFFMAFALVNDSKLDRIERTQSEIMAKLEECK